MPPQSSFDVVVPVPRVRSRNGTHPFGSITTESSPASQQTVTLSDDEMSTTTDDDEETALLELQEQQQQQHGSSHNEHVVDKKKRKSGTTGQLIVGAVGIWVSYLCYGHFQEDLFHGESGFHHAWFLQVLESSVHCLLGFILWRRQQQQQQQQQQQGTYPYNSFTSVLPFLYSGTSQVFAKACVSLSLAAGLSFPVATLAKSAKLVPVMLGSLLLGGATYSAKDYVYTACIVFGTAILSMPSSSNSSSSNRSMSTAPGLLLILASLTMDGVTAGLQKRLKRQTANHPPTVPDFLFFCSAAMAMTALVIATITGELMAGVLLLRNDSELRLLVLAACASSAIGQCFVFHIICAFDPMTLAVITTTRKLLSVLYSLSRQGQPSLSVTGYCGLILAAIGIFLEIRNKIHAKRVSDQIHQKRSKELSL